MPKHAESSRRPSFVRNLLRRGQKTEVEAAAAGRELDEALSRLTSALRENASVVEGVRRRQTSGALKIILGARTEQPAE